CVETLGHRVVNEHLLDFVETGSSFEKAGAIAALYGANMLITFQNVSACTIENATPESRNAYLALSDVWLRKRCVFLQDLVSKENIDLRRNIIPSLNIDENVYPNDLKPLVAQAINIARGHDDDYIRHRLEVQLGEVSMLKPIPPRDSPH